MQPVEQGAGEMAAVHRLALFDSFGNITDIISQLDILRRVQPHPSRQQFQHPFEVISDSDMTLPV